MIVVAVSVRIVCVCRRVPILVRRSHWWRGFLYHGRCFAMVSGVAGLPPVPPYNLKIQAG